MLQKERLRQLHGTGLFNSEHGNTIRIVISVAAVVLCIAGITFAIIEFKHGKNKIPKSNIDHEDFIKDETYTEEKPKRRNASRGKHS